MLKNGGSRALFTRPASTFSAKTTFKLSPTALFTHLKIILLQCFQFLTISGIQTDPEFKRWQQKLLFYLTTLNLAKFLYENAPKLKENETDRQVVVAVEAWKHADFLYKNYILNGFDNTLYSVYSSIKIAKELWDSLDKKYKTKDAGIKKFIVGKLLDYKMTDSKTVLSQVQEL